MYISPMKLAGNKVRQLHNLCINYCITLMTEDNMKYLAKNILTAYTKLYLCLFEHNYIVVHNSIEFKQ